MLKMKMFKVKIQYFILIVFLSSCTNIKEKPNILFIAVDDLRPELGCYGQNQIISPNIDKLAGGGVTFLNAYCNVPVCGASRASLLTGIRPTRTRFVGYNTWAEKDAPEALSLPEVFKKNGYHTISNGKVFHHINDIAESWSEVPWSPPEAAGSYLDYQTNANLDILGEGIPRGFPYECGDVNDEDYFDGQIASKTIDDIKRLSEKGTPFFLAAGFLKPHLPFNAPKKYWDLYKSEDISLPNNYFPPSNAPKVAIHNFGELKSYYGVPAEGPVSDSMAINLIHGYYACVSYVDAQIGRVLKALDDYGLTENTIVVLWGDHGWQLGEHSLWCKHANFNTSLNAPLIVRAPGTKGNGKAAALVEFVDIFPSLCELAGFELPVQLQGESFVELLNHPELAGKDAVYSRYINGESIKTKDFLYTEWSDKSGNDLGKMIYNHINDPEENVNIIQEKSIQDTIVQLRNKLYQMIKTRD